MHKCSQGVLVSTVDHGLIFVSFCHRWLLRCLISLSLLKQKMDFVLIWALCYSKCVSHLWILFRLSCWRSTPSTAPFLLAAMPLDKNPLVYMLLAWTGKQGWLHHLMKSKSHWRSQKRLDLLQSVSSWHTIVLALVSEWNIIPCPYILLLQVSLTFSLLTVTKLKICKIVSKFFL